MLPSTRSVLQTLSRTRLIELARAFVVPVATSAAKDRQVEALADSGRVGFRELIANLGRDELRFACKAHELDDSTRARPQLVARLLQAHGVADSIPPVPLFSGRGARRDVPHAGDIVRCRHRQWVVEDVVAPPGLVYIWPEARGAEIGLS